MGLLTLVESGQVDLVSSEALLFETERNPNLVRQPYALNVLSRASTFVVSDEQIQKRAEALVAEGFKPLDALHLASAEAAEADYLCTCDDRFLRKARTLQNAGVHIASPIGLVEEMERWL